MTHNRADFEALARKYFAEEKPHDGIIVAVRRSPQDIARRLLVILNHVTADEMIESDSLHLTSLRQARSGFHLPNLGAPTVR